MASLFRKFYEKVMNSVTTDWENARTTAMDLERLYNSLDFTPKIIATS